MPAPLAVDKDQVRMLVLELGVRDAARKLQLNENTVLSWSDRGGWLDHLKPEHQPKQPASMQPTIAIGAIKPVDALANTLADRQKRTKLGLSAWAVESSEALSQLKGEQALAAHQAAVGTASVAAKVWPEPPQQGQLVINLALLGRDLSELTEDNTIIDCP